MPTMVGDFLGLGLYVSAGQAEKVGRGCCLPQEVPLALLTSQRVSEGPKGGLAPCNGGGGAQQGSPGPAPPPPQGPGHTLGTC